ncbi:MAG: hypothetical protein ACRDV4_02050, partial [Acidimicrobiales bacterium]
WKAALPDALFAEVPTGMVPLPDQLPSAFSAVVGGFLRAVGSGEAQTAGGDGAVVAASARGPGAP